MRFRKSLKIAKGVKLNLSKTGASFTLGTGKGLSFNLGNKGAYLNWSIPGTGVYDRVRLDTLLKDKLGGLFGFGKEAAAEEEAQTENGAGTAAKSAAKKGAKKTAAKKVSGPSEEEMNALAQEIALINVHQQAIDVCASAAGALNAEEAETAIEEWIGESEAPIAFDSTGKRRTIKCSGMPSTRCRTPGLIRILVPPRRRECIFLCLTPVPMLSQAIR